MATQGPIGLQIPTFDDIRRVIDLVGALHTAAPLQRAGLLVRRMAALLNAETAAVDVTFNGMTQRLIAVGPTPDAADAGEAGPAEHGSVAGAVPERAIPRSGDRGRRLREERQRQRERSADAAGHAEPAMTDAAVQGWPDVDGPSTVRPSAVVHRQVARPPAVVTAGARQAAESVAAIQYSPPVASGGLAAVRSVYQVGGLASSLVAWRAAEFEPAHGLILRLLHPAVAWAIEPVRSAPTGVTGAVFDLMLTGLPEKEIARRLNRSAHTIHAHVKRVYRHFGVRSRSELIVTHFRHREGT